MKINPMAQWINLHRNNIFVVWTRLPLLCEKSGAILLVLVGFTAAWQAGSLAGRQLGRQSDEIRQDLINLESSSDRIVMKFTAFYEGTVLL